MTNPFARLKQLAAAEALLRESGFKGDSIVTLCQAAVELIHAQSDSVERAAKHMQEMTDGPDDEVTVKYHIPYRVRHTEHPNGGRVIIADGMTMVDIDGGINNWQQIQGVVHFIKSQPPVTTYNNPEVVITGLFPVAQWVPEKAVVVAGTN